MLGYMLGIWDRKIAQTPFKQRDSHEQDVRFNQKWWIFPNNQYLL